jgi:hypothetical protein
MLRLPSEPMSFVVMLLPSRSTAEFCPLVVLLALFE